MLARYVLAAFVCGLVQTAPAQNLAQLSGQVRDPVGAVVTDVSLTVIHLDTGMRRAALTGVDGWYAVSSLPAGTYKVTVRKSGFRTVARLGVHLTESDAARLDFKLEIGGMQEFITIEGDAATINTEDATSGLRFDGETARKLPVNGRALNGLISFVPGVLSTPATLGEAGQFSVNGQRPNANYFVTDGVSANYGVGAAGLPGQFSGGTLPAMSALGSLQGVAVASEVRELQVKTSTFAPEFGRMPGAQILVTTATGSNGLHGEVSYAHRHEKLAARDRFAKTADALRVHHLHLGVGGAVQRDRTFFFGGVEVLRLRQPSVWRTPTPSAGSRAAAGPVARNLLAIFPQSDRDITPLHGEATVHTAWPGRVTAGSLRIDQALGSTGALFVRYHDAPSANRVGRVQEHDSAFETRSVTVGVTHGLARSMVNDLRFVHSRMSVQATWIPGLSNERTLPALRSLFVRLPEVSMRRLYGLAIAGLGHVVWSDASTSRQGQFQLADTVAYTTGRHQVRFGLDYLRLTPSRDQDISTAVARYGSLEDLVAGREPATLIGYVPGGESLIEIASAFAQDTWSASRRLNLTYGLRWEYVPQPASRAVSPILIPVLTPPTESNGADAIDLAQPPASGAKARYGRLAPRAGLAYRIRPDGNIVLRAGVGVFYDIGFASAIDPLNSVPFNSWLAAGGPPGGTQATTRYGFATGLRVPYTWQSNVTIESALGRGVASVAWVGSSGRKLLRREGYMPSNIAPGPYSQPALILATSNGGSAYHGLQFHFRGAVAQGLHGLASYTWSHSIDNGSWDSGSYLVHPAPDPDQDRGSSNFDVRHSLSAGFQYDLPTRLPQLLRGWSLYGIARARTAFPVDILVADNSFGSGFDNAPRPDLVPGAPLWIADPGTIGGRRLNPAAFRVPSGLLGSLGRNAVRGMAFAQLDAAIERTFVLENASAIKMRLQAYNVANAASLGDPVRVLANPLFGQPASMAHLMFGTGRPISGITPAFQSGGPRTLEVSLSYEF